MFSPRRFSILGFFLLLLLPLSLGAQTTGGISGRVTDSDGGGLPGVTVEASSPALQGSRDVTTDDTGAYRLLLLPPGQYTVSYNLSGFGVEKKSVSVSLGKESTLDVLLKPASSAEITVSAEAPVLNTNQTSLATTLSRRAIETLPTARNYSSLAQVAPGTSSDANPENKGQSSITVYGSSGAENSYYIDGVNTTGVEYGFQGKELNFEFIQEIDVKTGGYEAEYGRSTGGIINVITKSGGNDLTGDVFTYYDNDSLQSNAKNVASTGGQVVGFTKKDFGIDVGGPIMRDKLWYFLAYDGVSNTADNELPAGPQAGDVVKSDSDRDLAAAKLTWSFLPNQTLIGSYFQDPRTDKGAISDSNHALNGDPLTYLGEQKLGGKDYALRYEGIAGSAWIFSGQIAQHKEKNSVGPATADGDVVEYREVSNDFFQTGGFGLIQKKDFKRDFYGGSATHFLGRHEVKGGIEYETENANVVKRMSGGQRVDVYDNPDDPTKPIYVHSYWTTPDATIANAPLSQLTAKPKHQNTTVYLQDRWNVLPNFTVNAGVRWDRQQIIDAEGTTQIDLKKDYAPRLGLSWDPSNDHKSKVFGSYGRYYEQIPMDLVIRSFTFERQPQIVNFSPTSTAPDETASALLDTPNKILGGFTEPADPNLKNQYMNEFIVGGEREVITDVAFGVKGIYRNYANVIEDFLCAADGTYCIGNPGKGIMKQVYGLDYETLYDAPKAKRTYKGIQLDATKRFSNNWQGMASYLWSKLDGNFDGEYAPFTNVGADPNISAAYDYFDFFTNGSDLSKITNKGPLSNDRRHQLKFSGVYMTPWKLSIGAAAYWRSGTPVTRYGYSDAYGRYEFFLTERGKEGRTPSNYDLDLHFGYPVKLGPATVNLLLDVFNALDTQRAVLLDQRWGFEEADNASATPVNPNYKKAVLRTPPTSARLGVRLTF